MSKIFRALLYCTKGKMNLRKSIKDKDYYLDNGSEFNIIPKEDYSLNGKIVIECDFEVEKIIPINVSEDDYDYVLVSGKNLLKSSCLYNEDICEYLDDYNGENIFKKGYAIHIKNLTIYDSPRELNNYYKIEVIGDMLFTKLLTKSPKNMMRVSINHWKYFTYNTDDIRIIIPVSSEEMCRIANKEQDILVRKRVLKEMIR